MDIWNLGSAQAKIKPPWEKNKTAVEKIAQQPQQTALPYIKNGWELIIPTNCPDKYKWWAGGQSIFETLLELNAPNSLIKEHVGELGSPKHWRQWQEILKERVTSREIGNKSYKELFADLKLEDGQ